MDGIEWVFGQFSGWLSSVLPEAWWSDLLINGVVAGGKRHYGFIAADNDIIRADNHFGR